MYGIPPDALLIWVMFFDLVESPGSRNSLTGSTIWLSYAPIRSRAQAHENAAEAWGPRWYAQEQELGVYGGLGFGFDPRCTAENYL